MAATGAPNQHNEPCRHRAFHGAFPSRSKPSLRERGRSLLITARQLGDAFTTALLALSYLSFIADLA